MKKICSWKYIKMSIIAFVFFFVLPQKVSAANSYSLITSGFPGISGDQKYMTEILQNNKLFSRNVVYNFSYNTEAVGGLAGTKKKSYQNAIKTAYSECTQNDTAFFFHSGHGAVWDDGSDGLGLVLKYGGLSYYKYSDLLSDLSKVNCKHMIVIIHACHSGSVEKAWKKLDSKSKEKITVFWSSDAKKDSYYTNNNKKVSYYGQALITMLGGAGELYGDLDNDGVVSVVELGVGMNTLVPQLLSGSGKTQKPGYITLNDYSLYSLSKTIKKATSVTLNKSSANINVGGTLTLKATVKGTTGNVTWTSSNSKIATVNKGKVKGLKKGTVTITATIDGKTAKCKVTVLKPSIKLNKTSATVNKGSSITLKATVTGSSKKVIWSSSDKKIATVKNGKVTGKKAGTVTISAKANGKTAKCKVTVKSVSKKSKALASYKSFLAKRQGLNCQGNYTTFSPDAFYIYDVNKDGIPELIVSDKDLCSNKRLPNHCHICLYTWDGNNPKIIDGLLTTKSNIRQIRVCSNDQRVAFKGYYNNWASVNVYGSWINNPSGSYKTIKMYSNTAANRKKYIK